MIQMLFKCHRKSVQTPRGFKSSRQTQHWPRYDTGMKSKHSFQRECQKNGHIVLVMNEEKNPKKTNLLVHLPARSPEHFPTVLMSIFRVLCQQNTSSTAPLRPAYALESHYQIHLFTEVFAQKLYKHSYTMEIGVLCN